MGGSCSACETEDQQRDRLRGELSDLLLGDPTAEDLSRALQKARAAGCEPEELKEAEAALAARAASSQGAVASNSEAGDADLSSLLEALQRVKDSGLEGEEAEKVRASARSAACKALNAAEQHKKADALDVLRQALADAETAAVEESARAPVRELLGELATPGLWEEEPSGDPRPKTWRELSERQSATADRLFHIYRACRRGRRADIGGDRTMDFELMTCAKKVAGREKLLIVPVRRRDKNTGEQTHPAPENHHPWLQKKVSMRERDGDWLTNDFFWRAFTQCLRQGGEDSIAEADELFDFQYNFDYRGWEGEAEEVRGGIKYSIPTGWKRFACRVKSRFGQDNSWLRLDGGAGEWAVAYHGTTYVALAPILDGGLKAGSAQAYQAKTDARTGETIGHGVYCTPSIEVATSYARSRGGKDGATLDGKSVFFVMQCRVRPEAIKRCHDENDRDDAYWVINDPADIRPYGVLVREVGT